jgi:hypothetical protein
MENRPGLRALGIAVLLFAGCSSSSVYEPASLVIPPEIKSIAVRRFVNKTQFYGLEEKLWLAVTNQFIQDGRIAYAANENQADGVLVGQITRYILQPIAFDANLIPQQYKLTVLIDIQFVDRVTNTLLWEEPRLEEDLQYASETLPGGLAEEDARLQIWNLFATDIVTRTLNGFGTVTGSPPRKIQSNEPSDSPSSPTKPANLPSH